jgi:hypothetical protein
MLLRKKHPLEEQAIDIAEQIRGKLTRMGLCHRAKYRDYDELHEVEFSQIEASPQFVKLRVDVDLLPKLVTTARLKSDEVLTDLGHMLGHAITFEDRDKAAGCWFVIHLGERDGIPTRVEFSQFLNSYPAGSAPMTIPIGAGVTGPVWRDLRTMPHLLIAGATGKGKSVMVHAIVSTLLHIPPKRLRLVLADLKGGMTLGKYKRVPHLARQHYCNRAQDLPELLMTLQTEMQRRAEAMENVAEDIEEWNRTRAQKWPYILVVIEELANAMLSRRRIKLPDGTKQAVGAATEELLADLAARARATGIHLIVTTQTPRSDVISGIIKANFPVRIAFGTASDMDSRVIIDNSIAQGLQPGRMAFLDCSEITMLQAPVMSEDDLALIIKKTLAGEHWLVGKTKEHLLIEHIHLVLEVGHRDFRGVLDIDRLYRAPDIKKQRMTPERITECLGILVADGAVRKMVFSRNYRIVMEEADWRKKYYAEPLVLDDWDAAKPVDEEGVIEGEVVGSKTTLKPLEMLLQAPQNQSSSLAVFEASQQVKTGIEDEIRCWDSLGYSRNEMVKRMGMDKTKALRIIASVLGPVRGRG